MHDTLMVSLSTEPHLQVAGWCRASGGVRGGPHGSGVPWAITNRSSCLFLEILERGVLVPVGCVRPLQHAWFWLQTYLSKTFDGGAPQSPTQRPCGQTIKLSRKVWQAPKSCVYQEVPETQLGYQRWAGKRLLRQWPHSGPKRRSQGEPEQGIKSVQMKSGHQRKRLSKYQCQSRGQSLVTLEQRGPKRSMKPYNRAKPTEGFAKAIGGPG